MLVGLIKSMRLRQWSKNSFVFVALFFDRKLNNFPSKNTATKTKLFFDHWRGRIDFINPTSIFFS